jgi:hypothetical protein
MSQTHDRFRVSHPNLKTTKAAPMNHTEEPWEVAPNLAAVTTATEFVDFLADGSRPKKNARPYKPAVCWMFPLYANWTDGAISRRMRADAERIVACVNACAGVPDAELKPGVVADLLAERAARA